VGRKTNIDEPASPARGDIRTNGASGIDRCGTDAAPPGAEGFLGDPDPTAVNDVARCAGFRGWNWCFDTRKGFKI